MPMDAGGVTVFVLAIVSVSVVLSLILVLLTALCLYFVSGRLAARRIKDLQEDVDSLRLSNRRTARRVTRELEETTDDELEARGLQLIQEERNGV